MRLTDGNSRYHLALLPIQHLEPFQLSMVSVLTRSGCQALDNTCSAFEDSFSRIIGAIRPIPSSSGVKITTVSPDHSAHSLSRNIGRLTTDDQVERGAALSCDPLVNLDTLDVRIITRRRSLGAAATFCLAVAMGYSARLSLKLA